MAKQSRGPSPAALERMQIVIDGVSKRSASAVDSLVEELRASGMSDASILRRVLDELKTGTRLLEMRRFATANVPGFIGDMTFRFARDTLSDRQKRLADFKDFEQALEARDDELSRDGSTDAQRADAVLEAMDEQGIDTSAYNTEDMMAPPLDADQDEEYQWITVHDNRVCEVCAANHGEVRTLGDWASIGEPRSGACLGDQNCRCVLVPVTATTPQQRDDIRTMGPIKLTDE